MRDIAIVFAAMLGSSLLCAIIYAWEKRKYPDEYFRRHFTNRSNATTPPAAGLGDGRRIEHEEACK